MLTTYTTYTYDAFGEIRQEKGEIGWKGNRYTYVGGYGVNYDSADKMYYMLNRWYAPEVGRFITKDPYHDITVGILNTHLYTYCNNNPVNWIDRLGLSIEPIPIWEDPIFWTLLFIFSGGKIIPFLPSLRENEISSPETGPKYPGGNPAEPPGPGYEWRGKGPPGSKEGSWYNPQTGESYHPDLSHPFPLGPHYDYKAPDGKEYRIYPDGRVEPKKK